MKFDHSALIARIKTKFKTREACAKAAHMMYGTLCSKIKGHSCFTTEEIMVLCDCLGIPYSDIPTYFFKLKSE